mmetsp:Transcript_11874/g.20630  ORF Transcript_11874/g.20630 Transcript_11874/m.20630 type:complete len:370 (+) Transcript_11874:134-1243(+)|eukprot:CAMPEP_0196655934 /NCGR_PEP_ID=MMETSP1086-20130531/11508_1 /TAXON_ID=77921 /ORGANISM="Cyanoptyche  gloeocystis , Strain SAG4.97" /LENGTH=369 /DNA_ID=CAMNT_0041988485 /DNA_START=129 /DNA_END=1238 /DNA_ORIENTATION=+
MATYIYEPLTLANGLTLKNRILFSPLTRGRSGHSRIPNEWNLKYYSERAGAGLVVTEATAVSETANGWAQSAGCYTAEMSEGWKKVADAVHEAGSLICLQLWHSGRKSHPSFQPGNQAIVAPSAIAIEGDGVYGIDDKKYPHPVPRALETSEIPAIVEDYKKAAKYALEAGIDMVEVHAANGYLINTFLDSSTNKRTDQYGGSVEHRFRFLKEVIEAVGTVYPYNRIGVRISPNGAYNNMGAEDSVETYTYVAAELGKFGLAFLDVMDGLGFGYHNKARPMKLFEFKKLFVGPVFGNVGYTRDTAEGAIRTGAADAVLFGRPFIANPDLVERFKHDWPLVDAPFSCWYTHGPEGYCDWPAYSPDQGTKN